MMKTLSKISGILGNTKLFILLIFFVISILLTSYSIFDTKNMIDITPPIPTECILQTPESDRGNIETYEKIVTLAINSSKETLEKVFWMNTIIVTFISGFVIVAIIYLYKSISDIRKQVINASIDKNSLKERLENLIKDEELHEKDLTERISALSKKEKSVKSNLDNLKAKTNKKISNLSNLIMNINTSPASFNETFKAIDSGISNPEKSTLNFQMFALNKLLCGDKNNRKLAYNELIRHRDSGLLDPILQLIETEEERLSEMEKQGFIIEDESEILLLIRNLLSYDK